MPRDTIAAIATPPGRGGIGIIRASGPAVPGIARTLLGRAPRARHAHYLSVRDEHGDILDTGLLLWFQAPASFTGEEVLELQLHGSRPVLQQVLRRLRQLGARQAEPGEFSRRAFLNGRIDLAQAEAIADLINARTEVAARAAQRSLQGAFSGAVNALVEQVIDLRVQVESAIDFSDEDIEQLGAPSLRARLSDLRRQLADLQAASRRGQRLTDGLHVVITGAPNAGKSSLLNALAASDRAIVTATPGTTRDLLREQVELDGLALTLVDTAGLRATEDPIEREGIRRALDEARQADLLTLVVEHGAGQDPGGPELPRAPELVVHNKIDLSGEPPRRQVDAAGQVHLYLSARTGAGLGLLQAELQGFSGVDGQGAFSARQRHLDALEEAAVHLQAAALNMADEALELVAEELRHTQGALARLTGAFGVEDLLEQIFSSFCIGK